MGEEGRDGEWRCRFRCDEVADSERWFEWMEQERLNRNTGVCRGGVVEERKSSLVGGKIKVLPASPARSMSRSNDSNTATRTGSA